VSKDLVACNTAKMLQHLTTPNRIIAIASNYQDNATDRPEFIEAIQDNA
jgi:hypothetical protein